MATAGPNKLKLDAFNYNFKTTQSNAIINANIAAIKAEFDKFTSIALISPYTMFTVDSSAFNGSTNNAILLKINNVLWTTVSAHADLPGGTIYYKCVDKNFDGSAIIANTIREATGGTAYSLLKSLRLFTIIA
jgi:hypothetical protein